MTTTILDTIQGQVSVNFNHIRDGKKNSCEACPVALALRDAFPEIRKLQVTGKTIYFYVGDEYYKAATPYPVMQFIRYFDGWMKDWNEVFVSPFTFPFKAERVRIHDASEG